MADPRIKTWYDYIGAKDPSALFPVDDNRSLDQRRAQAQRLREMGIHVPVPKSKEYEFDAGQGIGKYPISIGALAGMTQKEADQAAESAAGMGQFVYDYGTLPLYFTPAAPFAAAIDVSRGIINRDPIEVSLGALGIARPLKAIQPTMSEAAEKAWSYAFGAGGTAIAVQDASPGVLDLLLNIEEKAQNEN